jgi:hypothetical protein
MPLAAAQLAAVTMLAAQPAGRPVQVLPLPVPLQVGELPKSVKTHQRTTRTPSLYMVVRSLWSVAQLAAQLLLLKSVPHWFQAKLQPRGQTVQPFSQGMRVSALALKGSSKQARASALRAIFMHTS